MAHVLKSKMYLIVYYTINSMRAYNIFNINEVF